LPDNPFPTPDGPCDWLRGRAHEGFEPTEAGVSGAGAATAPRVHVAQAASVTQA
jgi:hypothetical protein